MKNNPVVITGMAGIFPGASNPQEFWKNILKSEVAQVSSLAKVWGKDKDSYIGSGNKIKDRAYLDEAFLIQNNQFIRADDKNRQEHAGKYICSQLSASLPKENLKDTGLTLGVQWAPASFLEKDSIVSLKELGIELNDQIQEVYDVEGQIEYIGSELGGPKLGVDVTCASSLYALAQGMAMIESGQARHVVVMGLNLAMPLSLFIGFSFLGALDRDKRIRSYMENAAGTLFGEAVSGIVIEKLDTALQREASILGIIKGVGLSSDGADKSIFSPGKKGQELIFKRAYEDVEGVPDYLEGHGTGTPVGDKVEIESLDHFFKEKVQKGEKIPLGAAKNIVGHSLAAAGMTSIVKALLILKNRVLPPHIGGEEVAHLSSTCVELLREPRPITKKDPVMVGVSSLGFGGGNAHVVLEEYVPRVLSSKPPAKPFYTFALNDIEFQVGEFNNSSSSYSFLQNDGHHLFPSSLTIETKGLRSGPNFLKNIDPFQLLALDKAHTLFGRHPELKNSENTAVMMHTNLGSELFLRVNRRIEALFNPGINLGEEERQVIASQLSPNVDNEVIASCMPTMCSAYPALHMNTNGFHMTTSGKMDNIWSSLINGLFLAQKQGNNLIIGAGQYLKSPLEVKENATLTEYLIWFQFGLSNLNNPLLLLHYFPESTQDDAFTQLEWHTGKQPVIVEPHHQEKYGPELLLKFILEDEEKLAIKISNRSYLLFEKKKKYQATSPKKFEWPLEIKFNEFRRKIPPIIKSAPMNSTGNVIKEIIASNEEAIIRFFKLQEKILRIVKGETSNHSPVPNIIRSPQNIVIKEAAYSPENSSAKLIVEESHPYFFDHPLDHVPAILMLEGICQLLEVNILRSLPPLTNADYFVSAVNLRFLRSCNKTDFISITAEQIRVVNNKYSFKGKIMQNEKAVTVFELEIASHIAEEIPKIIGKRVGLAEAKLLHKKRVENVMIGTPRQVEDEISCPIIPCDHGHFFSEGHPNWYSPCFILETCRQFSTLLAHDFYAVPINWQMQLVSVELKLNAPLVKGEHLYLKNIPLPHKEEDVTQDLVMTIDKEDGEVGLFKSRGILLKEVV